MSDQILFQHPIFHLNQDDRFSFLLEPLRRLLEPHLSSTGLTISLNKWLISEIFDNKPLHKVQEEFNELDLLPKTLCGKVIEKGSVYFYCVDCEIHGNPDIIAIICAGCYENSNHDGHRIVMAKQEDNSSPTCDCGDEHMLKPDNFCLDHQPHNFDVSKLLQEFPQQTLERCKEILPKVFYTIVTLFEMAKAANNKQLGREISILAQKMTKETLEFYSMCYSELNKAFVPLFAKIFQEKFPNPYNKVWHNCEDLKGSNFEGFGEHFYVCECTVLGNLLRLGNTFDEDKQSKLVKILLECSKEAGFKEFLGFEFVKYFPFLFTHNYTDDQNEDRSSSQLTSIKTQLFTREDFRIKVLEGGYFHNIIAVAEHAIHNSQHLSRSLYDVIAHVKMLLFYFFGANLRSAEIILKDTNSLVEILNITAEFQSKFFYDREILNGPFPHGFNPRQVASGLMVEKGLTKNLEYGIEIIFKYPAKIKKELLVKFIAQWYNRFQVTTAIVNNKFTDNDINFHLGLERIFSFIIGKYMLENSLKGLEEFIEQVIPRYELKNSLTLDVLSNSLRILGMTRYLFVNDCIFNNQIWNVYYYFMNTIFEADIFSVQMMSMMSDPNELFEIICKNFFSYNQEMTEFFLELQPIKRDHNLRKKIQAMQDFLNFIVYIMNDELCLLNLTIEDPDSSKPKENINPRFQNVLEKVLINLLLGVSWTDFSDIKTLSKEIFKEEADFTSIVTKIAIKDDKTHKIKIKEEYSNDFDPYIFYRTPILQKKIISEFSSSLRYDQQIDLISGKFYTDLPEYLRSIQKNFYLSKLPSFLSLFVIKLPQETITLIRPVLKLILLNLQVACDRINTNDCSTQALIQRLETNYLTQKFSDALKRIPDKEGLSDCEACVIKIQKLLNTFSSYCGRGITFPNEEHIYIEKVQDNMSKEMIPTKKEEFARRKAIFISKTDDTLKKSKVEEHFAKEERITCQYCLEKIQKSKEIYGIPIYITFTNNMYDSEKEEDFDSNDKSSEKWWPVVSSCHHFYHKKCFEIVNSNSRSRDEINRVLFSNKFETSCPLCKMLCNYFLCANNDYIGNFQRISTGENEANIYTSLSEGLQLLYQIALPKFTFNLVLLNQKLLSSVENQIFRRAYYYFLEGFYLISKPNLLRKSFISYYYFLRALGAELALKMLKEDKLIKISPSFLENINEIKQNGTIIKDLRAFTCESILNKAYLNILFEGLSSSNLCESAIEEKQLSVLKEYLIFKIVQALSFEKHSKLSNVKEIKEFYDKNQALCEPIIKQLIFPVQKILLASFINKAILFNEAAIPDDLWELLCQGKRNGVDYLEALLKLIEPSLTLKHLLERIFAEVMKLPEHHILLLNSLISSNEGEVERSTIIKLSPKMIELPKTLNGFVSKYLKIKCSICKDYGKNLGSSICLICGEVICAISCNNSSSGNLNKHARTCHLGLGIFIGIHYMRLIVISSPINSVYIPEHIYIDSMGQSAERVVNQLRVSLSGGKLLNFNNFKLNEQFVNYIKEVIYSHNMAQKVFEVESENNMWPPGYI